MSLINIDTTDNFSGILSLEYLFREDISTMTIPETGIISASDIVLKSGKAWNAIQFTKRSIQISSKLKDTAGGTIYETTGKFRIPKDDSNTTQALAALSNRYVLIRETDMNGRIRIIGSIDRPAKISFDISKVNYNGYECDIYQADINPPPYFTL